MKNKHILFMLFQLKSVLRDLPRLLICFVALALVILIAGVCGNGVLNSKNTPLNIKVGTVTPSDDSRVSFGITMLQSMESINEVCTFEKMDLDTAKEKLDLELTDEQLSNIITTKPEEYFKDLDALTI